MEQTGIQAGPPVSPTVTTFPASDSLKPQGHVRPQPNPFYQLLLLLASLRITVVLFALSMLLVLWGTLAQVDLGIWSVMAKYFRSWVVFVPINIVLCLPYVEMKDLPEWLPQEILFPGGWLIGSCLMTNLIAAHIVRFHLRANKIGIWLLHLGVVVLMIGEYITGTMATEANMTIFVGKANNYKEETLKPEIAITRTISATEDEAYIIPKADLVRQGKIEDADKLLPFNVTVDAYYVNSMVEPLKLKAGEKAKPGAEGHAEVYKIIPFNEGSGVKNDAKIDMPSAYVTLTSKTGAKLGTYLVSAWLPPDWIDVDGKTWEISLRFKRTYCDYTIHLTKFSHEVYPGTTTPRNFRSDIRLVDAKNNVDRPEAIYMNHPLRYEGETFYQSQTRMDQDTMKTGTVLQVVKNPVWTFPYIACLIGGLGMLIHFGQNLIEFLKKQLGIDLSLRGSPSKRPS